MPFISQSSNPLNKTHINKQIRAIRAQITSDTWEQDNELYTSAMDRTPEDTFLIANYAQFLDATGKSAEAIEQAERFCALLPDLAWTHYYLAALLTKAGRLEEARESLKTALEIRDNFTQARELLKRIN
jgi:tetratricopeptide (TPR) repeat protein